VRFIDDDIGKGLFATQDIERGSVIFKERPLFAQQWSPNKLEAFCCAKCARFLGPSLQTQFYFLIGNELQIDELPFVEECGVPLVEPVSCPYCNMVYYCSNQCMEEAEPYHNILCTEKSESAKLFLEHAQTSIDRFILAGEIICHLIFNVNIGKTPDEAYENFKRIVKGSWLSLISNQEENEEKRKNLHSQLLSSLTVSHGFLTTTIKNFLNVDNCGEFMTIDFYDQLLGMFELNNPSFEILSPLHQYLGKLYSDKEKFTTSGKNNSTYYQNN